MLNVLSHLLTQHFKNNCSWIYPLTEIKIMAIVHLGFSKGRSDFKNILPTHQTIVSNFWLQNTVTRDIKQNILNDCYTLGKVSFNFSLSKLNVINIFLHAYMWDSLGQAYKVMKLLPATPIVHALMGNCVHAGGDWQESGKVLSDICTPKSSPVLVPSHFACFNAYLTSPLWPIKKRLM